MRPSGKRIAILQAVLVVAGCMGVPSPAAAATDQECSRQISAAVGGTTYPEAISKLTQYLQTVDTDWGFSRNAEIVTAEHGVDLMVTCRANIKTATGKDLVSEQQQANWNLVIRQKADLYVKSFLPMIEKRLAIPGNSTQITLSRVYESHAIMAALARARPDIIEPFENELLKYRYASAMVTERRDQRKASQVAVIRKAALEKLPPMIGLWKKAGPVEYERVLLGGMRASMYCTTTGGIGLEVTSPAGKPFVSEAALQRQNISWVPMTMTTGAGNRNYRSTLKISKIEGNTRYYYGNVMLFEIDDPVLRGKVVMAATKESIRQGRQLASKIMGVKTDPSEPDAYSVLASYQEDAIVGDRLHYGDINEIRNLPSARVTIYSDTLGRVELLDLSPTKPPFRSLMEACGN